MGNTNKNHKISLERVIGNVVNKLQLTDVSSRISAMAGWAVDAELKIGSRNSYEKFECEIEVSNYRACLPENFVRMLAVKIGNNHLDYTMKDFRQFSKGATVGTKPDNEEFNAGNKIRAAHPGVPNVHQVDFGGVFSAGDIINIIISNDNCGDVTSQTVTYTVQPGDDIPAIIAAFVLLINATSGGIYTAVPDSSFLQIMANTPLINMNITTWTNSITGLVSNRLIQRRILPTEESIANPDNCEVKINTTSPNLANHTAYNLNDGIHSQTPYENSGGTGGSGNGQGTIAVSKYAIENGYVHFNAMEEGRVGVAYYGIAVDDKGWPLIDPQHEDAITHYLMYQLSWGEFKAGKVTQAYFQTVENRWYWLCGQARGDDELPDDDEMQYLANAWNQLLPLPNHNFF